MRRIALVVSAMALVGGARTDVLTVTGTGADDSTIPARTFAVRPNAVYGVRCRVRHPEGPDNRGIAVIGLLGCNDYLHVEGNDWVTRSFVVPSSATAKKGECTVRQWHLAGRTEFDALDIAEVTPVYRPVGDVRLGYGESADGSVYHFGLRLGEASHGHSRALVSYRNLEGRYVYPPPACFETTGSVLEGPVDSIRFEMLREGLEDFEYFALLERRDPKHPLLAVPPEVTTSLTDYSLDPAAMESHRLRLARALEGAR